MFDYNIRRTSTRIAGLWLALLALLLGIAASPALATSSPASRLLNSPTPQPTMPIIGTYVTPVKTPLAPIPPPMATPKPSGDDMVMVLLIGSDNDSLQLAGNTDVLVLAAIDRTTGTVTLMQLPRDLFVYAPNNTMVKLNTVAAWGDSHNNGQGIKLLEDTILYNFGIKIDFFAHVNFASYEQIIGKLGGLDISIDCAIQDYRLKSPTLDYKNPDSYELYTLLMGYKHLDPYMALWYVRTRAGTSDFDRGRREMDVLRALWREAKNAGLLSQAAALWPEAQQLVQTDMSLQDVLGFAPLALSLQPGSIQRIQMQLYKDFVAKNLGSYVLIPNREAMQTEMQNLVLPPPANRLNGESPTVEIGTPLMLKGFDQVAADRLAWSGFNTKLLGTNGIANHQETVIYDYTGNAKPSSLAAIVSLLRINKANVIEKPDPNRTVDFHVEMGYDYATCLYALPPSTTATPQLSK
jgi:LCP family protein required for cell wall assembly